MGSASRRGRSRCPTARSWWDGGGSGVAVGTGEADTHGYIQRVDPATGAFDTLYDACDGIRLSSPNDIVFDEAGGFWFTDLGHARGRSHDVGAVFYAAAD